MRNGWSRKHLERRVDRYHKLAAGAKLPEVRRRYVRLARRYRLIWRATQCAGSEMTARNVEHLKRLAGKCRQLARHASDRTAASLSLLAIMCDGLARDPETFRKWQNA